MKTTAGILIVDDEARNLDVLESLLHSPGCRLVRATSANDAFLALMREEFAVLIIDIHMPGIDGLELARLIRQRRRAQHIPILFLTAYSQDDEKMLKGYSVGAVDYLTKPINPDILRSKVGVFVDLHRKRQALAALNLALEQEIAQRQKAEAALHRANEELEDCVRRRTDELTRTNEALRESEAHLRLIADHVSVFIVHLDRQRRFKFVNRAYAERHGLPSEKIVGAHLADIAGRDAYRIFNGLIGEAFLGRRVEFEREIPYDKVGPRWEHVLCQPECSPDGKVIGVVAVIADTTARKRLERETARARDEALAVSRAKDDFLAKLSHELRTPLNPILLLASDAVKNPALSAEVRADFDVILRGTTVEARLIDDLLDVTRITHGKLTLERRPLDVHSALEEAIATVRPEIEAKRIRLTLALGAESPRAVADPVRLQQVFWNVLKNAAKFTEPGGRIHVRTSARDAVLRVIVRDNGFGLTRAELGRVFKPFTQGEHLREGGGGRFGGLGLGLAITDTLVEMHGGRIYAESAGRGRGAVFIIELPLVASARAAEPGPAPVGEPGAAEPLAVADPLGGVLLVDDDAPTLRILAHLLRKRSFEVIPAGSVAEARAIMDARPVRLLISDVGLPDGDGWELMAESRARRPGLAGIALSGYGTEEDRARSRSAGFAAHLTKPVNISALEDAISRALGRGALFAEACPRAAG